MVISFELSLAKGLTCDRGCHNKDRRHREQDQIPCGLQEFDIYYSFLFGCRFPGSNRATGSLQGEPSKAWGDSVFAFASSPCVPERHVPF